MQKAVSSRKEKHIIFAVLNALRNLKRIQRSTLKKDPHIKCQINKT